MVEKGGRKVLNLKEQDEATKMMGSGLSVHTAALKLGVWKTPVTNILEGKVEITSETENNAPAEQKSPFSKSEQHVKLCVDWS